MATEMGFPAVALLLVTAALHGQAASVEELISEANESHSPFTGWALERLHDRTVWGVKHPGRSTDIVIMNFSEITFGPLYTECVPQFSHDLFPQMQITGKSSTVLGIASLPGQGDLICSFNYQCERPIVDCMGFKVINPVRGAKSVEVFQLSTKISLVYDVGQDDNNQVVIQILGDSGVGSNLRSNRTMSAAPAQEMLKGSRNKFVKASKRGSRVRTM